MRATVEAIEAGGMERYVRDHASVMPKDGEDTEKLAKIRAKYTEEAKKRLRSDGAAQFQLLKRTNDDQVNPLIEDLWANHEALDAAPSPITETEVYPFFVVGAGYGGLLFAVRLIEAGVAVAEDIRLVDAAGGFGGTWYWNRYPGLHCDIESYMYLPLLEETGYVPKHRYSTGAEVREHAERIASKWNLEDKTLFRADVESLEWDDTTELWTICFNQRSGSGSQPIKRKTRAQYVYLAAGILTNPQIPKLPDLSRFEGPVFHTARWNYQVSGGSQENQILTGFQDKKVAVVGTAATGIGVIPEVAKYAKELLVFQRTPAYVKTRGQGPTDLNEYNTSIATGKGWQFNRQINFNKFLTNSVGPGEANLVKDAWTDMPAYSAMIGSPLHGIVEPSPEVLEKQTTNFHILDLPHMEAVRARVDSLVENPDIAAKLKPWYPTWCKRPTFSDTYLQAFNRSNVHLVDTEGKGPSHATERGLVVAGKEYPVDVIVFGTGYEVGRVGSPGSRIGVKITGRNGQCMDQKWDTLGAATLHGWATNGFPNLFFSGISQATMTGNNTFMLDLIAQHVVYWIVEGMRRVDDDTRAIIEVTREGEEAHTAEIVKRAAFFSSTEGCTPGYFNGHGTSTSDPEAKKKAARGVTWSEGSVSFLQYLKNWRDEGSLKGMEVVSRPRIG